MKKFIFKVFIILIFPVVLLLLFFVFSFVDQAYFHFKRKNYRENLTDTASPNVQVLKDTAYIDYLDAKRTLHVYLPPSYYQDSSYYPVIYFFDAGSLFNDLVLEGPEWQVDEVMDKLAAEGGEVSIVIGIENSKERMTEYKPFSSPLLSEKKEVTGDKHAAWVATDLKAWVDTVYRTKPEARYTSIGGASLGGLMAYYTLTTYPEIFGNAIVMSPSFWVNEKVYTLHQKVPNLNDLKIYMNVGRKEGFDMIWNVEKMYETLIKAGMSPNNLRLDIERRETHWHPTWRKGFKKAYPWIIERP